MWTLGTCGNKKTHKISAKNFSWCKGQKWIDKELLWLIKHYMKEFLKEKKDIRIIALFPYDSHVRVSAQKRKKSILNCLCHPTSKIFTYKIRWTSQNTSQYFMLGCMTIRTEPLTKSFIAFTRAYIVDNHLAVAILVKIKTPSSPLERKILLKPG